MEVQLFGLSSYYAAVVAMATLASLTTTVVVVTTTIAAYGLSFFFSSAVADVAEMVDASKFRDSQNGDGLSVASFFS